MGPGVEGGSEWRRRRRELNESPHNANNEVCKGLPTSPGLLGVPQKRCNGTNCHRETLDEGVANNASLEEDLSIVVS